jgi:hypothetical protein
MPTATLTAAALPGTLSTRGVYGRDGWLPLRVIREALVGEEPCHMARAVAKRFGVPVAVVEQIERSETWLDEMRHALEERAAEARLRNAGHEARALDEAAMDLLDGRL